MDGATTFVYGLGGAPIEQVNGAGTQWFFHDQVGSTRALGRIAPVANHPNRSAPPHLGTFGEHLAPPPEDADRAEASATSGVSTDTEHGQAAPLIHNADIDGTPTMDDQRDSVDADEAQSAT